MGVSASCERRLEVRALEWRRFGFGIADSFQAFSPAVRPQPEIALNLTFDLAAEVGKGCPPRIDLTCIAVAYLVVAITSASRAEPFAFLLAERSRRQGQQYLLAQYVLNRKTASFIVPDFGIGGRDSVLRGVCVDTSGSK